MTDTDYEELLARLRTRQNGEIRAVRSATRKRDSETPGAIFRRSTIGRQLATGRAFLGRGGAEVTHDPWELAEFLRLRTLNTSPLELFADVQRTIQVRPTPTALLPLCTTVPVDTPQIPIVSEQAQIEDAAYAPDATNLPGISGTDTATFTFDRMEAKRIGRNFPVPQEVLADEGQTQMIVDRLISANWARAVESYVVAGNPSITGTDSFIGITSANGVVSADSSSYENGIDALAAGVESIETGGWYGPHVVAAAPSTLERLFTLKDTAGNYLHRDKALPTVAAWAPTPGLPDGTAVVLDPAEIYVFLFGTFAIDVDGSYGDYFSRGLTLVQGVQRVAIWVRSPDANFIVTGL